MKRLVIVESPTKAKTISKFLGKAYTVESSFGHVRDLPKSKMGVDIKGGTFAPEYIVPKDKTEHVKKLKALGKKAEEIIFATDEDREGEAISWHLAAILGVKPEEAQRIAFHEITKTAIDEALKHPRHIDQKLVDAQQARRVLDRLVGYELSPLLWSKVARGLSAGRVQSVAVRLVVEREREIQAFKTEEYWSLLGTFASNEHLLTAELYAHDKKKLDKFAFKNKEEIDAVVKKLSGVEYTVANVIKKEATRTPPPPFTTSTLQQAANHKLGFSAKQTMRLAQQLYEGMEVGEESSVGLITYMRTDSVNLSEKFIADAGTHILNTYGDKYSLKEPRHYATKSKGAQEAHEAIRPSEAARTPESVEKYLTPQQYRLYALIWKRAVATQMAVARVNKTIVDIETMEQLNNGTISTYTFRATGQTMLFDGWMKLYPEAQKEEMLPELTKGAKLINKELKPEQHFTEPPARYSDATLVKIMEEYGIGRPSTYAPTIATIEDRNYVERDEQKRLKPTDIAFTVNDLLVEHFSNIVDYKFTAEMEENLDEIAEGTKDWQPIISTFYHPFHETIEKKKDELNKKDITEESTNEVCPKCGNPMVIKIGRFGKFMACTNYPECKTTKPIGKEAEDLKNAPTEPCDKCGKPMVMKRGRFGTFMGCSGYPDCKNIKKIEKKTGVKCNKCGLGEFVEKKSKRGKPFYSCNRYPECENALWSKPTGEMCPTCSNPLVFAAKGMIKCSNKECGFEKISEAVHAEPAAPAHVPENTEDDQGQEN